MESIVCIAQCTEADAGPYSVIEIRSVALRVLFRTQKHEGRMRIKILILVVLYVHSGTNEYY